MAILRLYFLQVVSHSEYKLLAVDQHSVFQKLFPKRGEIYLKERDGVFPAAINRETQMVYAVPRDVENIDEASDFLSLLLGIDREEIKKKLSDKNDVYEPLKHKLSEEEIAKIKERRLRGIELLPETYRYYPGKELASSVLGFVGWKEDELVGRYGLEAYFEENLRGKSGQIFQNRDASGRWISIGKRELEEAKDGDSLVLTIDHIVQFETEKVLEGAVKQYDADGGTVLVIEPESGNILSMASYPNFNPNEYSKVEDIAAFRNLAVSAAYESGSVFKPITMAAGLDSGRVKSDTTYIDTGSVVEAGYTIRNSDYKSYGQQTMTGVLENSLNTGVIFVEKQLGNKNFLDYVKRFGFGELTGIETIGESPGNINNLKNLKSDIQFFTASFGQGITVTPIQLAMAYGAVANGGVLMRPKIIDKIMENNEIKEIESREVRRVISKEAARELISMLVSVVKNGHGKKAGVPGYLVGGKTGTAQVASTEKKGYEEGVNIGSFVGLAPANDPRFVVVVRINNPRNVEWAESSAAPACGEIMKFLLEYYRIEPTEKFEQKDLDIFQATHNLREYAMKAREEEREKPDSQEEEKK